MLKKIAFSLSLFVAVAAINPMFAADPTQMSDANTSLTFTAGAGQAHCQALTQDTNTDWVMPSVQEAMIFAGDSNDSAYVWTDTVAGDFDDGGNSSNPKLGKWLTVRLSDGDLKAQRATTSLQVRCVR